jgi:RNA polymerase sigma-70 factor (ECF subfamily)
MSSRPKETVSEQLGAVFRAGPVAGLSDGQLLERFLRHRDGAGDAAFEAVVRRHGPMVLAIGRDILRDEHAAEDAFQATFLVLARRAATVRDCDLLAPWLARVARRVALRARADAARRRDRERRRVDPRAADSEGAVERDDARAILHAEIDRLAEKDRIPVVLCYLEGKSYEEAAGLLRWPVGTIRSRLSRAKQRLRDRLARRGLVAPAALLGAGFAAPDRAAAAIPPTLLDATVRSASRLASGEAIGAATASAAVAELTKGALTSMTLTRTIRAAALAFGVILTAVAAGALAQKPRDDKPRDPPPKSKPKTKANAPAKETLLSNAGFEDGRGWPEGWTKGAAVPGVQYLWDRKVAHEGKASLCLKKTANRYFPIAQCGQSFPRKGKAARLKVSAWVKAEKATKAILDVQFSDTDDAISHEWAAYIGAKEENDPPATHDWKLYEGTVDIPEGTTRIAVAAQIYGPGTAWFDDLTAELVDAPGAGRAEPPPAAGREEAASDRPPDPRAAWLRENGLALRSIDPSDADFSDLRPLARAIGDARIVLLGEPSHGDGAAFLAKCRLIRFLHEEMGFDVLAWESGLFDCREMDAALRSEDVPLGDAISLGIFPIWAGSGHVTPVFRYARSTHATPRPLEMAGFDCQFSSPSAADRYPGALFSFLDRARVALPEESRAAIRDLVGDLASAEPRLGPPRRDACRRSVESAIAAIERSDDSPPAAAPAREREFYARTFRNLLALDDFRPVIDAVRTEARKSGVARASDTNLRDAAMAENLAWLARRYHAGKKIIAWAASFHILRDAASIDTRTAELDYASTVPMGHKLRETFGDSMYTVAFTAYRGRRGNPFFGSAPLPAAEPDSFEAACHDAGHATLFLDLRGLPGGHWLRRPVLARPLGYAPMLATWPRHFDAFVFTDAMFPSTADGRVPREPAPK